MCATMQNFSKAAEIFEDVRTFPCVIYFFFFIECLYKLQVCGKLSMVCTSTQVARSSLDNTLLKYAAKDYFFKAAVCHFCISPQAAQVSG